MKGKEEIQAFMEFLKTNRLFYVDEVRKWMKDYDNEEISFSKFVELFNEKFFEWHKKFTLKLRENKDEKRDWVYRYDQLRESKNMMDSINQLVEEAITEKDLIIYGIEEGAEQWKAEYDNCRAILQMLVELKRVKDTEGKNEFYETNQPITWEAAKKFLEKYQHE